MERLFPPNEPRFRKSPDAWPPASRRPSRRGSSRAARVVQTVVANVLPPPPALGANSLSAHILPTSATLVGACITAISVVKIMHPGGFGTLIDKLLALDSLLFLASGIVSFVSMRVRDSGERLESIAELFFLFGLGVVTVGATVLAFAIG